MDFMLGELKDMLLFATLTCLEKMPKMRKRLQESQKRRMQGVPCRGLMIQEVACKNVQSDPHFER